jgi:UDP-N-acetylmuramoyl-tripeptide--D-alanyl-D-alanine ligase
MTQARYPQNSPQTWTVADCTSATGGNLLGGESAGSFDAISIDSRQAAPGDLFVAIKGETHDGHNFAAAVVDKGIKGLLLARARIDGLPWKDWAGKGVACLVVDDTIAALGRLAAFHRRRNNAGVVGITGSNGKTTTRKMTAMVVARQYRTLSTRKNFNNNIGVPLTLFGLGPEHRWAVVELGMNAPGEIAYLADICRPAIGVITNVAPAHLEGLGSVEGVMHAKGELLDKIDPKGKAVLNADDPMVRKLARRARCEILLYGTGEDAAIRAENIAANPRGNRFDLILPDGQVAVDLKIPGRFMVLNALAAAAVGHVVGVPIAEIKGGLETFAPVQGRLNILSTRSGIHLIDDTYNANPGSMAAALATLEELRKCRRAFFVVGDMRELGQQSQALHVELGALAARSGITALFVTGEFSQSVAEGAGAAGLDARHIIAGSKDELLKQLLRTLEPGDWVLVKGSRAMAMEEIVGRLREWADR